MCAAREVVLTLSDVENSIFLLEKKYGFPTLDFLRNPQLRSSVIEDDVFEWEAFIEHRRQLREVNEDVHREYLSGLTPSNRRTRKDSRAVIDLAA